VEQVLYNGWEGLARTLVVGVLAYASLIVALRCSGKRTLSKMNAFDLIVTVSLGSTLASALLNKGVALAEGVLAFVTLVCLQFAITWTSVRVPWFRRFVTGDPLMLLERGEFLPAALRRARVTEGEVRAAIRSAGVCDVRAVTAVVLETDGSFSVVHRGDGTAPSSSLEGVQRLGAKDVPQAASSDLRDQGSTAGAGG
jgi:uncharacterized membrane protein YcaP (DUF421 family)